MNKKLRVGVAGAGFVGKAVVHGFSGNDIFIADPKQGTHVKDFLDKNLDVVFICCPTPMGENCSIDVSIVASVMEDLSQLTDIPLVLKSTVTPDLVDEFSKKYSNFVYNPEFLTEANFERDFEFPFMQVFGGTRENTDKLEEIYKYSICKESPVYHMTAKEASFVKYSLNSFLALKVIFWNQMKELMEKNAVSYENVRDAFITDPRIGSSHTVVPGPDGRRGFGSACFSKDIPALIKFSDNSLNILREAWNVNCNTRNAYGEPLQREKEQHVVFNKI